MSTNTISIGLVLSVVAVGALTCASSAQVASVSNRPLFDELVQGLGGITLEQDFSAYNGAFSVPVTGSIGSTSWVASAPGGLSASDGILSTQAFGATLTFSFSGPDLLAVGGDFFAQSGMDVSSSLVQIVAGGASYTFSPTTPNSLSGFVSFGGSIQSISITPFGPGSSGVQAAARSLVVGVVPAPGAAALLALAGLSARRRRG